MTEEEIRKLGKEALKHCEQYLGTDKWDVAMLAIAKGYELAEEDSIFNDVKNRKDFLSVDGLTAISSEGEIFHIGNVVKHESQNDEEAIINSFSLNQETMDVIAHTSLGTARISFIYNK